MSINSINCTICQGEEDDEIINIHNNNTNHFLHKKCLAAWDIACRNHNRTTTCPICREIIDESILNIVRSDDEETQIIRQRYNTTLDSLLLDLIDNTFNFITTYPKTSALLFVASNLLYSKLLNNLETPPYTSSEHIT